MRRVGHFELESHLRHTIGTGVGAARDDVDVLFAERIGHVAQQLGTVERHHFNARAEHGAGLIAIPLDVDQARRLLGHQALGVGAVRSVYRHTATAGDEADDVVARHRRAATRQPHQHIIQTLDVNTGVVARPTRATTAGQHHGGGLFGVVAAAERARNLLRNRTGRHMPIP